jgi:hypothetical protein
MLAAGQVQAQTADLSAIRVLPERSQSAEQSRRDRFECHNWAIEQTGSVPERADPVQDAQARKAERADKVVAGAAVGAAVGGIVRGNDSHGRDAADGALGGAVLGAVVGAILGRDRQSDENAAAAVLETPYVRALSACLEGRGYAVVVTGEASTT